MSSTDLAKNAFSRLEAYCERESFIGYDPYDGLNSTFFNAFPTIRKNKLARLVWIQLFKRSPFNFRPIVGVAKGYNPKALGLFLTSYCSLYRAEKQNGQLEKIKFFSEKLLELQNNTFSGSCWGYNFDWQARAFFQPKNTPTVVATAFIACALLDAYEITGDQRFLKTSRSACDFVLRDLNRSYDENGNFAFSYSPLDKSTVFNASLLGARLLSRVYNFTKEDLLIQEAKKTVEYCCGFQNPDGSWAYGTYNFHQWVDNFHTGYNLECIQEYMSCSGDFSYQQHVDAGFTYYINTFFTEKGVAKYYNNSTFPIDIHSSAQLVITLSKLNRLAENKRLLNKVMSWTITNMQSEEGYFYYQINKYFSSRIPYMRWAQAWMFYALSTYLTQAGEHSMLMTEVLDDVVVS